MDHRSSWRRTRPWHFRWCVETVDSDFDPGISSGGPSISCSTSWACRRTSPGRCRPTDNSDGRVVDTFSRWFTAAEALAFQSLRIWRSESPDCTRVAEPSIRMSLPLPSWMVCDPIHRRRGRDRCRRDVVVAVTFDDDVVPRRAGRCRCRCRPSRCRCRHRPRRSRCRRPA